uniref:Aquaporin n=1 Tax=Prymnesium polylepis TaxID=72548 RepID=A0A7S4I2I0_9EUKA
MPKDIARQGVAEFAGTATLVATIIGSGIMGDTLSTDDGVALLGNTLATWGILFVLITIFGPVSGAHFNPVVTYAMYCRSEIELKQLLVFVPLQFGGAILGAVIAHGMFDQPADAVFEGKYRDSLHECFAEAVSTVGLLMTILGSIGADAKDQIPMAVGLYITAGYWFTSSTSFANPAVTIGRTFTNTFASINPNSVGPYFAGQAMGLAFGLPFCEWMWADKSIGSAILTLIPMVGRKAAAPQARTATDKPGLGAVDASSS